jgi:hypothetical protein
MAEIFGTRVMDPNGEFTLNMVSVYSAFSLIGFDLSKVNVELPLPGSIPWSLEIRKMLDEKMLNERNAFSAHFYHNGRWWTRCSAQIYNEVRLYRLTIMRVKKSFKFLVFFFFVP